MNPFPTPFPVLESLESRLAPAGIVALTVTNGVLTITGDVQSNEMQIIDAGGGMWTISGTVDDVANTGSATMFTLNGGAASASVLLATPTTVRANFGTGDDVMQMTDIDVAGSLTVDMGIGNDEVDLTSTSLLSTVTVKMGAGADYFTAGGDLVFGKSVSVDLGTGANTFDLNATTLDANGSITAVAGGTAVESQAFLFAAGTGEVAGSVTLRTSTASPTTFEIGDLAGDDLQINGAMTLQAGSGADSVTLRENLYVHTSLNIKLSNGNNSVTSADLDTLDVGSLVYTGGTGNDEMTLNGNTLDVYGKLSFTAGAGTNILDLNPATSLTIGGALTYSGGTGTDSLYIDGPDAYIGGIVKFTGSSGSNYLAFNAVVGDIGGVSYSGGSGSDIVDLGEYDGLTTLLSIYGNVGISASTGSADVQLRNVDVHGALTISSNVGVGGIDTTQILETVVGGVTTLNVVGRADADVVVRDSIFDRSVVVSTGGGDDYVAFDTDTDVSTIYSSFYGAVRINLGDGNDIFAAGATPIQDTVGNDFYSSVYVNGGYGYDRVYFLDSETYNNGFNGPVPWVYAEEYA
jgi:hypothetical protein